MLEKVWRKKEPTYTVGGNENWHSHHEEWCGDSLKKKNRKKKKQKQKNEEWNYYMIQQSHYWAYTLRRP